MGDAMKFEPEFIPQNPYLGWLCHRLSGWQFGEQGLLMALSEAVECNGICIEYGAGDGESLPLTLDYFYPQCPAHLLLVETEPSRINKLKVKYPVAKACSTLNWANYTAENVSIVVIDIDGKDSVVMRQMLAAGVRPGILMVEHMDRHYPIVSASPEPLPEWALGLKLEEGHSLQDTAETLHTIAAKSGYERVGYNRCNSVFVRRDLFAMLFRDIGSK